MVLIVVRCMSCVHFICNIYINVIFWDIYWKLWRNYITGFSLDIMINIYQKKTIIWFLFLFKLFSVTNTLRVSWIIM